MALLLVMVLLLLVIVTAVLGGAGVQHLGVRKIEGVRAFYAAEAGLNMALRELVIGMDEDGDGIVGSIATLTALPWTNFAVTMNVEDDEITLESRGTAGQAARVAQISGEYSAGAGVGMIAYSRQNNNAPAFRLWNSAANQWGAEQFANDVGSQIQWLVLRGATSGEQFALATLDNDQRIRVQIWDGEQWGSVFQVTADAGEKTSRVFDMAYESLSGRLVIVYRRQNSNAVGYRVHTPGVGWSAELTHTLMNNAALWIRLVPMPGTDDILVLTTHDSTGNHTRHALWNGTAIVDPDTFAAGQPLSDGDYLDAVMRVDGSGMAVYTSDSQVPFRTFDSVNWSGASNLPSLGSKPLWNRLVAQPDGSEIILATLSENKQINVNVWNGSAWGSNVEATSGAGDIKSRNFDVAYERDTGRPVIFYDSDSNVLRYRTWDANAGAWSSQSNGPSGGSKPIWNVQAATGVGSGHVLVAWSNDNRQVRSALWNGSSFSSSVVLATANSPKEFQQFMIAVANDADEGSDSVKVLSWGEVAP